MSSEAKPHRKVAGLGAFLLVLMALVVGLGVLSLTSIQHDFEQFAEEDFPGFNHLLHVDRDLFRAQHAIETSFLKSDPAARVEAIAEYESQVERTDTRWSSYLDVAHRSAAEIELQNAYALHRVNWLAATGLLVTLSRDGRQPTDPEVVLATTEADQHFSEMRAAVHELEEDFYEPLVEQGTNVGHFDARLLLIGLLACGLSLGGVAALTVARTTKRQYLELRRRELYKRFRSLVESAQDVITVVSDVETLTVMSPDLGALQSISQEVRPSTVSDLLCSRTHNTWASADRAVLHSQDSHSIELETGQPDGTTVYIEAHGSPMIDEPSERVWVWRDITARKELELQLSHLAFHDSLTGVANRSLLHDRVENVLTVAARTNKPVTILFCDLDEFKTVNDSLGHGHGDELLKIITQRIKSCVRGNDTVARLGGDEFAVLLDNTDTETAVALAERMISVVAYEVELDEHKIFPSVSIGIATASHGTTTEELLRNADLAMYAAKRSGKGCAEIYQDEMHRVTSDLLELQADLKTALARGEFSLHYQPTVSLGDGTVEGVEALIRWTHPTRGNIPPDHFIQLAEATGMIIAIGRWALREACRAAVDLQRRRERRLLMAVNLSPQQLRDPTIVRTVEHALSEAGLEAESLILEVTEGTLLDDTAAVHRLHELRSLGVLIAVDDFGTGYTSLGYLQSLPINILKIDRSFVSGDVLAPSERQAFLKAIVGLTKSLSLRSVAEGIEDASQLDELAGHGCEIGQGFFWSRAVPLDELDATIDRIENLALAEKN